MRLDAQRRVRFVMLSALADQCQHCSLQVRQAAAAAIRELLYFDALCGGDLAALQQSCSRLAAGMRRHSGWSFQCTHLFEVDACEHVCSSCHRCLPVWLRTLVIGKTHWSC